MAKVVLALGAVVGIALGLLLPAPAHGVHHMIVPGASSGQ